MLPLVPRQYLLSAMEGTPEVLEAVLRPVALDSSAWDRRPDPARFTAREVVAHLADWEPIWWERVTRTLTEDRPLLPTVDQDGLAVLHDYAGSDPRDSLRRFQAERPRLLTLLRSLPEEAWERLAERESIGTLTLSAQMTFLLAHDGYHLRQIVQQVSPL